MEKYVENMMEEHAQLVKRIVALDDYIYSEKSDKDDKVEFANKCIQLAAMKKYAEALGARLENKGIIFDSVSKVYLFKHISFVRKNRI